MFYEFSGKVWRKLIRNVKNSFLKIICLQTQYFWILELQAYQNFKTKQIPKNEIWVVSLKDFSFSNVKNDKNILD